METVSEIKLAKEHFIKLEAELHVSRSINNTLVERVKTVGKNDGLMNNTPIENAQKSQEFFRYLK